MTDEEKKELEEAVNRGNAMHHLSQTPAWNELVLPEIHKNKAKAIALFEQARTIEQFVAAQQCFTNHNKLENFVNNTISMGQAAFDRLHPEQ